MAGNGLGKVDLYGTSITGNERITVLPATGNTAVGFTAWAQYQGKTDSRWVKFTVQDSVLPVTSCTLEFPTTTLLTSETVSFLNSHLPAAITSRVSITEVAYPSGGTCVRLIATGTDSQLQVVVHGNSSDTDAPTCALSLECTLNRTDRRASAKYLANFLDTYVEPVTGGRRLADFVKCAWSGDTVSFESLVVNSASSRLRISGSATAAMWGADVDARGTTRWLRIDTLGSLVEGDGMQVVRASSTDSYVVQSISDPYLCIDKLVDTSFSYGTGTSYGIPHIEFTRGDRASFDAMNKSLATFIAAEESKFFSELNRYTNMLCADNNPTEAEITAVANALTALSARIGNLQNALQLHTAYACKPVDDLIKALQEKGCDRAVDLLTSCRFQEFFGIDINGSSYAGTVMSGLQSVAQQDLPVSKYDRASARTVVSSASSTDYETDFSDAKTDPQKYGVDNS